MSLIKCLLHILIICDFYVTVFILKQLKEIVILGNFSALLSSENTNLSPGSVVDNIGPGGISAQCPRTDCGHKMAR